MNKYYVVELVAKDIRDQARADARRKNIDPETKFAAEVLARVAQSIWAQPEQLGSRTHASDVTAHIEKLIDLEGARMDAEGKSQDEIHNLITNTEQLVLRYTTRGL